MANPTLVETDYLRGRQLVETLLESDFPIDVAAWRFDDESKEWELLIASPEYERLPPSHSYKEIQRALALTGIDLPLSRIHLVSGTSRFVANLRAIAESPAGSGSVVLLAPVGEDEPPGSVQVYRSKALEFEREIFAALQGMQTETQILRRNYQDPLTGREIDFLLDDGTSTIVIETQATIRPLGLVDVHQLAGVYVDLRYRWQRPLDMLLISKGGFTKQAESWRALDRPPRLVDWTEAEPTRSLQETLRSTWKRLRSQSRANAAE